MTENIKKSGRKLNNDITNNDMLIWIERYLREYPNEDIKISKLAKYSKIPRHYWYYRKEINNKIEEINKISYEEYDISISSNNKYLLELPDVESLIESNYLNKRKLKQVITSYFDTIQEFYKSACDKFELDREYKRSIKKISDLEYKLKEVINKLNYYKELAENYEKQIRYVSIRSMESQFRQEYNIKENIIKLDKSKKKMLTTNNKELDELIDKL